MIILSTLDWDPSQLSCSEGRQDNYLATSAAATSTPISGTPSEPDPMAAELHVKVIEKPEGLKIDGNPILATLS
jgi:hypothetical protein